MIIKYGGSSTEEQNNATALDPEREIRRQLNEIKVDLYGYKPIADGPGLLHGNLRFARNFTVLLGNFKLQTMI